jgi:transcription initiation factor TFIID subunit 6
LFFDKIRTAILDTDNDPEVVTLRESALESVRSDPGLHQLVPYFVQFVAEKVTHNLMDTFVLRQMMELTAAVIANKSLFVDPYVASLIPPILTCLIGRHLGPQIPDNNNMKEKYQLRDLAASLIGQISTKYSKSSAELQARLCRTCLKYFLDPTRTLGEHYGAIVGITSIGGAAAVSSLVLPNLKAYEYVIIKAQNERGQNDNGVHMLLAAIMRAVASLSPQDTTLANGANGANGNTEEGRQVEAFLGSIIGSRVAGSGNHGLMKAILEVRDKQ